MFSAGFIQKATKGDLFIKGNYRISPRKQRGKILEDSRRLSTEADPKGLPPVGHPAPRATRQPPLPYVGSPPPLRLHLRRSLSRFDPRAHIGRFGLYISAPAPLKASSHLIRQKP